MSGQHEVTVVDTDRLRITSTPGDTDVAVVAFSGVGMAIDQLPREEFVTTLKGATHGQMFVIDKARSWYNATAADIVAILKPLLAPYRKVVTLGNSMGGFGAVYFAPRLPNVRTAIAFSPQFSVQAAIVPAEKRWAEYRSAITSWTVRHAMEDARDDAELLLFFGTEERRDDPHRELFRDYATCRTAIFDIPEARHGTARHLKRAGLLGHLLDSIIVDEAGAVGVAALLAGQGVPHGLWRPRAAGGGEI